MSTRVILTFFVLTVFAQAEDEAWQAPTQIVFNNGTTLHNVSVVRWEKDRVIVKHRGGVGPAMFRYIKTPSAEEIAKWRAESDISDPKAKTRTLQGQVFITTAGAGAYKFSGATIFALPGSLFSAFTSTLTSNLPLRYKEMTGLMRRQAMNEAWIKTLKQYETSIVAKGTTDADGNYKLEVPTNHDVMLTVLTSRQLIQSTEQTLWLVKASKDQTALDLNGINSIDL